MCGGIKIFDYHHKGMNENQMERNLKFYVPVRIRLKEIPQNKIIERREQALFPNHLTTIFNNIHKFV